MARFLRKVTSFTAKADQAGARASEGAGLLSATIPGDWPLPETIAEAPVDVLLHDEQAIPTTDAPAVPDAPVNASEVVSAMPNTVAEEAKPRSRGRPRLDTGEDRKPMGHRVPAALLRQLTLIAAELAYLEDRKVQQQDLVAAALEEFIARQKIRIEQLRRQRQL